MYTHIQNDDDVLVFAAKLGKDILKRFDSNMLLKPLLVTGITTATFSLFKSFIKHMESLALYGDFRDFQLKIPFVNCGVCGYNL